MEIPSQPEENIKSSTTNGSSVPLPPPLPAKLPATTSNRYTVIIVLLIISIVVLAGSVAAYVAGWTP